MLMYILQMFYDGSFYDNAYEYLAILQSKMENLIKRLGVITFIFLRRI